MGKIISDSRNKSQRILPVCYPLLFALLFLPARNGLGMFWDWDWPLFRDHLGAFFSNSGSAWNDINLGQPMLYNSGYYLRWLLGQSGHLGLNPETVLYLLLIIVTSSTAFGTYLFARRKLTPILSWLLGTLVIFNPAYLYKLVSGHFFYLISFAIFVYFLYYLFYKFKNNFKTALALALLFAFLGAQIQFFIFALIALLVFYIVERKHFKARYLVIIFVSALLINLPWLINFLIGANQLETISGQAGDIAFSGASRSSLFRIATLSFSDATLIKYFYSKYIFVYFALFSLGLFALTLWRLRKPNIPKEFWYVLPSLLIFIFLGTGIYQGWNIPVVKTIYPMLRESGHLAPVIVLFMILLLVRLWSEKKWLKWPIIGYLVIFAVINAVTIYKSLPTLDYSALRARLAPYKEFLDQDGSVYRIAAYPFFGQYSVAGEASGEVRGQPIRNTGIDEFTQNSPYDSLSNYIPAQILDRSVQFQLLTTLDLSLLEERNIKYLLDFSDIYQSNIERYSDPSFYGHDLSIVKNNPALFQKLQTANPGRLVEVAPHIYQLTHAKSRVEAEDNKVEINKINPSLYRVKIKGFSENTTLNFYSTFHQGWVINSRALPQQVVAINHHALTPFGQSWLLPYNDNKAIAENSHLVQADGSFDLEFNIYFEPDINFAWSKYFTLITLVLIIANLAVPRRPKRPH